jgi:hypothetical protein
MARAVGAICVVLAAGALVAGFAFGDWGLWAGAIAFLGALWLLGSWRGAEWISPAALVGSAGVAAIGLWLGLGAGWMVSGFMAALCAWELDRFSSLLRKVGRVDEQRVLETRHLARLLLVSILGAALAALALRVELTLSFAAVALLALLAVWGLARAVRFLRRESD